jgi:hypothetical protein
MPQREPLGGADPCRLASRWLVRQDVLERTIRAAQQFEAETGRKVWIISGYRTPAEQRDLKRQGRPAAAVDLSNHTSCPATAVDVSLGFVPTNVLKATWGRIVVENGLRWGGGSPVDDVGIPSDWNHVDLGPRSTLA